MDSTTSDVVALARGLARFPHAGASLRQILQRLADDLHWTRIQLTVETAAVDDAEHRLDIVAERHSERVPDLLDPQLEMCARCMEAWPCADYRAARGIAS